MINKCRIFLKIISIYELLIFYFNKINPSYFQRVHPPSRLPTQLWPKIPSPSKKYFPFTNITLLLTYTYLRMTS
jgi:hypothetical protein